MSFILIGDVLLNLMAVSCMEFEPAHVLRNTTVDIASRLTITVIGRPYPLHLTGDDAVVVWTRLKTMATPLERFSAAADPPILT